MTKKKMNKITAKTKVIELTNSNKKDIDKKIKLSLTKIINDAKKRLTNIVISSVTFCINCEDDLER